MNTELQTFDGKDNRKELMVLLQRLGDDSARKRFLESLIPASLKGFADCPMKVQGACDPVAAYFVLVSICNEVGVPINEAARRLEAKVKKVSWNRGRNHP